MALALPISLEIIRSSIPSGQSRGPGLHKTTCLFSSYSLGGCDVPSTLLVSGIGEQSSPGPRPLGLTLQKWRQTLNHPPWIRYVTPRPSPGPFRNHHGVVVRGVLVMLPDSAFRFAAAKVSDCIAQALGRRPGSPRRPPQPHVVM